MAGSDDHRGWVSRLLDLARIARSTITHDKDTKTAERQEPSATLQPVTARDSRRTSYFICDGYVVTGVRLVTGLVGLCREVSARHPEARLLATLDDVGQACYTSGHTVMRHDLDENQTEEVNEYIDEEAADPVRSFSVRYDNLKRLADATDFPIARLN